jgi:hypothetical protein
MIPNNYENTGAPMRHSNVTPIRDADQDRRIRRYGQRDRDMRRHLSDHDQFTFHGLLLVMAGVALGMLIEAAIIALG